MSLTVACSQLHSNLSSSLSPLLIPSGRSSFTASIIENNLYIFSGENIPRHPIDDTLYIFNLRTLEWSKLNSSSPTTTPTTTEDCPCARVGHAGTVVNSSFYIYGGRTGINEQNTTLNDFWTFSTETQKWKRLTSLSENLNTVAPPPLSYHTLTANESKIFLFGGCTVDKGRSNEIWQFDIELQTWEQLFAHTEINDDNKIPCSRGGSTLLYIDNELHVLFGYSGKSELADHFIFNLTSKEWRSIPTTIPPRSVTDAVFLPSIGTKGSIFVFGGETTPSAKGHEGAGKYLNDIWIFNLEKKIWQSPKISSTISARGWGKTLSYDNPIDRSTSVLIIGGFDGNERLIDIHKCEIQIKE